MARRSEGTGERGTAGLGLFARVLIAEAEAWDRANAPTGPQLRDAALAQSAAGRQEAIQRVREWLVRERGDATFDPTENGPVGEIPWPTGDLTADDVHDALDALGLGEGDTRWSANILRGWEAVIPTERFVPCRRKSRHSAPTRVWQWR